jgi:hypothetical protein
MAIHHDDEERDDYYDLTALARKTGVSPRTIRRWIDDPKHPLPTHHIRGSFRDRGRVLILRSEFEAWVRSFPPAGGKASAISHAEIEDGIRRLTSR